jgi:hypothetical protein
MGISIGDDAERISRLSASTSIAGIMLRCREQPVWAKSRHWAPWAGRAADPSLMPLILRRANVLHQSGWWVEHDFGVFGGDHELGRIYRVLDRPTISLHCAGRCRHHPRG